MSNILKQYRVAGEDKNVRVINSNSMIKQIFADSISRPADSYTGISSDAQSSLEKTKSLSPVPQESIIRPIRPITEAFSVSPVWVIGSDLSDPVNWCQGISIWFFGIWFCIICKHFFLNNVM